MAQRKQAKRAKRTRTKGQKGFPAQHQRRQPGREDRMRPRPRAEGEPAPSGGKLAGRVALVTGGDSGIGRAIAAAFAREGADVAIVYLDEHKDAEETRALVEDHGQRCLLLAGDVGDEAFCRAAVQRTVSELGRLDVLVNNAAEQHWREGLEDVDAASMDRAFRTNIYGYVFMAKHALPHLKEGASILNTTSVTAFKGSPRLLDYSATKGAIVAFTRSLAKDLAEKGIRVNAIAPGPVWTPLIPASFPAEEVEAFGKDYPLGAMQPEDIAPTYVFLASDDGKPYAGQVLHPNSGRIVGS